MPAVDNDRVRVGGARHRLRHCTPGWLALKLALVLGLFVPMEILDTWPSHFHVPHAMRNKESQPERFKRALRRQDTFLKYSSWLVLLLVPSVLFLALVKPL